MDSQNEEVNLLHVEYSDSATEQDISKRKLEQKDEISYKHILQQSINKVHILLGITLVAPFCYTTRLYVIELYMHSLPPPTSDTVIASLLLLRAVITSISSLLIAWFGDKYGHDKSLLLALVLLAFGVLIESLADNLFIFIIGAVLGGSSLVQTSMAYIAWVLPHKHAVSYMSKLYSLFSVLYLSGPLLAAFIVQVASYRAVFWVNTVIISMCLVIEFFLIVGSQKKLHSLQLSLSAEFVEHQDKNDSFPVCNVSANSHATDTSSWSALFVDISGNKLILLVIAMIANCVTWAIETVFLFYFALFMVNRFKDRDISLLYTSGMFLCMTVCFGGIMLLVPKIIARIIPKYIYLISMSSLCLCMLLVVCMMDLNIMAYWFLTPFSGLLFGAASISTEMCILETQPKQHSGKVSGTKELMKNLLRGIAVWCTGLLWHAPYFNGIWIVDAFAAFLVFLASFGIYWFSRP